MPKKQNESALSMPRPFVHYNAERYIEGVVRVICFIYKRNTSWMEIREYHPKKRTLVPSDVSGKPLRKTSLEPAGPIDII